MSYFFLPSSAQTLKSLPSVCLFTTRTRQVLIATLEVQLRGKCNTEHRIYLDNDMLRKANYKGKEKGSFTGILRKETLEKALPSSHCSYSPPALRREVQYQHSLPACFNSLLTINHCSTCFGVPNLAELT